MGYYASFDVHPVSYRGLYWTPCNNVAPPFGVKIGGTVFNVSSADIIVPYVGWNGYTSTTGEKYCHVGIFDMHNNE